ncbi:GAF domain-containing protein [Arthrobacter bussei]|uniref:GAF domain-containing protein n=1 Tax=Arthrobacter bussei TaxID=2594179 RepID=A0A7X1NPF0_9MICC|nr:GAF domain-containing protein [Arthrobacter bussei]MPY10500.1 GAF domain-containing protein [Arthrobacter bussei]
MEHSNQHGRHRHLAEGMRRSGLSVTQAWIGYFAQGGTLSEARVAAYLEGLGGLPAVESDLLAEVVHGAAGEGTTATGAVVVSRPGDGPADPREALRPLGAAGAALLDEASAERERLHSLDQLNLLDTPPEERFDRITRRAAERFRCELATLALIGEHRQFIKSAVGDADQDLERTQAFCNETIRAASPLVLTDTLQDERFRGHTFVSGAPYIRFYAGCPLRGPGGWLVGSLCVMSTSPRAFSDEDLEDLEELAQDMQREVYPGWKAWRLL